MLALLGFLEGPLGKLAMYLIGGLFAAGTLIGVYFTWKHQIQAEALLQYNKTQLEQTLAKQEEFTAEMQRIGDMQLKAVQDLQTKNDAAVAKLSGIEQWLSTPEAQKGDRDASDVLKKTIQSLGGAK